MTDPINALALRLLCGPIEAVPRYRLLRDVLLMSPDDADLADAWRDIQHSRMVSELSAAQHADGSWGRFYTRNKNVRFAARTTETALIRAKALGLDASHPMIMKAIGYLEQVLDGQTTWPDRQDPTLDFPHSVYMVTAARLRQFSPNHPLALREAYRWRDLIEASFSDEGFDDLQYQERGEALFDRPMPQDPRMLFSQYSLMLLQGLLPEHAEINLIRFMTGYTRGIYLINNRSLWHKPLSFVSRETLRYIRALELLGCYLGAEDLMQDAIDWLWEQRGHDGMWDMGPTSRDGLDLPLSESWRRGQRPIDCTVRMLILLQRLKFACRLPSARPERVEDDVLSASSQS